MTQPYASLKDQPVVYAGPPTAGVAAAEPVIGLFGPQADKLAASLHPRSYRIVGIPSEAAWGKSSTDLVNLIYQQNAIGLIATDRAAAHLAEQLAVKTFFPVIALSSDHKLTSTNIPWIFRLNPGTPISDAVDCLIEAARQAGPNRESIRDYLASGKLVAGRFSFASDGEPNPAP